MATVQRYVDTASAGGDGTTEGHSGGTAAYANLASWESSEQTDLVSDGDSHVVDCSGSAADTVDLTAGGWTTGASNTITVRANRSATDSDGFYNGTDIISTSHYRLAVAGSGLSVSVDNITFDGIQFYHNSTGTNSTCITVNNYTCSFVRCRVAPVTTGYRHFGIRALQYTQTLTIDSCLIAGFGGNNNGYGGLFIDSYSGQTPTINLFNNTIYGNYGWGVKCNFDSANGNWNVKNNIIHSTTLAYSAGASGDFIEVNAGSPTRDYDYNAVEDDDLLTTYDSNLVDLGAVADTTIWTNPGTAITSDFDLKAGSPCIDAGISIGESTDITDTTRAASYDIGAFDYASVSAAITGTAGDGVTEAEVTAGGETIIITLTGDTFVAAGTGPIGSTADTLALIAGISAATSPALHWNAEWRDNEVTTAVARTSNTVATITMSSQAAISGSFDPTANETITITIPAAVLTTSASPIVATPTFQMTATAGAAPTQANTLMLMGAGL